MFYLSGLIYIIGAVFYCIFSSGNKQAWAADYSSLAEETDDDEQEIR